MLTSSYLQALVGRQIKDLDRTIGPIAFEPTDALVGHYCTKVLQMLTEMLTKVGESMVGPLVRLQAEVATPQLRCVIQQREAVRSYGPCKVCVARHGVPMAYRRPNRYSLHPAVAYRRFP